MKFTEISVRKGILGMSKEYIKNLSIIVPHYNTPDLLQRLIVSIPELDDIQVIVVDDKSDKFTDKLEKIRDQHKNRVAFYRNDSPTKGAGTCRNIGLRYAAGKWILFADADDFFLDGMYEAVKTYFDSDFDEVFFVPTSIYADSGEPSNRHIGYERQIKNYIANPTRENLLKLKIPFVVPWSKLIRHDLIQKHGIQFEEVQYSNDILFSAKIGHYSQKVAVSEQKIYCCVKNADSLTTQHGWAAYEIRFQEYLKVCDFLKAYYSRKDLRTMHYTCVDMLYIAVKRHYGMKRYLWIVMQFLAHRMPLLSWDQFLRGFRQMSNKNKFFKIRQDRSG